MTPRLYFLLPVYNESKSIYDLLEDINTFSQETPYPIHVFPIDDASVDDSKEWIEKAQQAFKKIQITPLTHETNKGLHGALNTGLHHVEPLIQETDYIVTMDGDNTHNPFLLTTMIQKHKEGADLVLSSRYCDQSVVSGVSFFRLFLSFGARVLYQLFWHFKGVKDYTCLFRSHKGSLLKQFFAAQQSPYLTQQGFACTTEFLAKLMRHAPLTVEVPIILQYGKKVGVSNVRIMKTILTSLKILIKKIK